MPKVSNDFQNYIKSKKKYSLAYANKQSTFSEGWRENIFKIKSFLSGNKQTDKLLYLSMNYFRLVSHKFADYEIGDGIDVIYKNEGITNKVISWRDSNNIQNQLYKTVVKKSEIGYSIVRILNDGNDPVFQRIPVTNYFTNISGLSLGSSIEDIHEHNIIAFEKIEINGGTEWRTHIDSYIKSGDQWVGTYGVYKYSPSFKYDDSDIIEIKGQEILNYLPIFIFNNDLSDDDSVDIDLSKDSNSTGFISRYFGESDYIDIFDIVNDLNDRQSQISVEFIKNLTSKLSLPQSFFDEIKNQNMQKLISSKKIEKESKADIINDSIKNFDYISHGPQEAVAQYLTKDPSMIDRAFDQITSHIRHISTFTTIPPFMLGLEEKSGNRKVGTDLQGMSSFLQRVTQKRLNYYSTLQKLFAYVGWILGDNYELPTIKFSKLPNGDLETNVNIAATMKENGFLSNRSLMKFVNNFDDQEAEEELKIMDEEFKNTVAKSGGSSKFLNGLE